MTKALKDCFKAKPKRVKMHTRVVCVFFVVFRIAAGVVVLVKDDAHSFLDRKKRANSGYLEELKQGNLERECIEEICNYEEAREVFEDDTMTKQFWMTYHAREPCLANPCKNNGTCIYLGDTYQCQCLEGFEGAYCQEVFEDTLKCLYLNGGCEQFCDGSGPRRTCGCAHGYSIGEDGKSCVAQVQYPCGKIPHQGSNQTGQLQTRLVGGNQCPKGHCPWQVLLQHKGQSLCGGVLVDDRWVVTAAHCLDKKNAKDLTVVTGEHDLEVQEGSEQKIPVSQIIVRESYDPGSMDSDLALLRLSEPAVFSAHSVPICLPTRAFAESELSAVRFHKISGWGRRTEGGNIHLPQSPVKPTSPILRQLDVPVLLTPQCALKSGVNITDNMFCAGYMEGNQESCRGDDGSPLVTQYKGTYFLSGVVSWGRGCAHPGYYGIYTKVSNFLDWLQERMAAPPPTLVNAQNQAQSLTGSAAPPLVQQKKMP
ncbi:coagulation factor VII [Chanos chanos]|uniref:Coagulation factor VII n=1 Tax=Chanos chanos TaxID=29144 RepID=A0A6J2VR15_CHACN|nr:coagulation factor VII-like [Chanos chanos]